MVKQDTKTADDISEELCERFVNETDTITLDQGISLSESAHICDAIASAFRDRAQQLHDEAQQPEED